jgi:hypothetical protein
LIGVPGWMIWRHNGWDNQAFDMNIAAEEKEARKSVDCGCGFFEESCLTLY